MNFDTPKAEAPAALDLRGTERGAATAVAAIGIATIGTISALLYMGNAKVEHSYPRAINSKTVDLLCTPKTNPLDDMQRSDFTRAGLDKFGAKATFRVCIAANGKFLPGSPNGETNVVSLTTAAGRPIQLAFVSAFDETRFPGQDPKVAISPRDNELRAIRQLAANDKLGKDKAFVIYEASYVDARAAIGVVKSEKHASDDFRGWSAFALLTGATCAFVASVDNGNRAARRVQR